MTALLSTLAKGVEILAQIEQLEIAPETKRVRARQDKAAKQWIIVDDDGKELSRHDSLLLADAKFSEVWDSNFHYVCGKETTLKPGQTASGGYRGFVEGVITETLPAAAPSVKVHFSPDRSPEYTGFYTDNDGTKENFWESPRLVSAEFVHLSSDGYGYAIGQYTTRDRYEQPAPAHS